MNLSLVQKKILQALIENQGAECATVAYDPTIVVGTPEADAIADGWVQWNRQATPSLVEVIYTR